MLRNYLRRITEVLLLLSTGYGIVYGMETVTINSVKGDVFLLSSQNRWERLYPEERFNHAIRIRTEKNGAVDLSLNNLAKIALLEDSMFELNEGFSERSSLLSISIFYGSLEISLFSPSVKMMVITPCKVYIADRSEFRINLDSHHTPELKIINGKVIEEPTSKDAKDIHCGWTIRPDATSPLRFYADVIISNIKILEELVERFSQESERLDQIVERSLLSKKKTEVSRTHADKAIGNILDIVSRMNIAKSRINMFSYFLRNRIEENYSLDKGDEPDEMSDILESVKAEHQRLIFLKGEYNRIVSSDIYSLFKTYDSIKNGKRRR